MPQGCQPWRPWQLVRLGGLFLFDRPTAAQRRGKLADSCLQELSMSLQVPASALLSTACPSSRGGRVC